MAMVDMHWETTKPVPNTNKVHFVRLCVEHHVLVADTSASPSQKVEVKTVPENHENADVLADCTRVVVSVSTSRS